jgi:putative tryptophan/tyrosine transport system substrate-binding protein
MVLVTKCAIRRVSGPMVWVVNALLLALPGCSDRATPSLAPTPVKLAKTAKLAVIRLSDPTVGQEPSDAEIKAGLKYAGIDESSYILNDQDAKGDLTAVPGLIDAAVSGGAELLFTLLPETTAAAAEKKLNIPIVFQMTGEPAALGLRGKESEQQQNITGAYTTFRQSLMVPIAQGCLPKEPRAHKLGILFNPDNRFSVIHKDALVRTDWGPAEPVLAEFRSEADVPAAVRKLIEQKAEGVILVSGIGKAAKTAIEEASRGKVPTFGFLGEHAVAGAIVAREPTTRWGGFEAGRLAGRVLRGEQASHIGPVEGVDYLTYANPDAAKTLGVTILGALMRNARVVSTK